VWKAKQKASPREALGEVEARLCLSREDKGRIPLSFGSIADASCDADLESPGHEFTLTFAQPESADSQC